MITHRSFIVGALLMAGTVSHGQSRWRTELGPAEQNGYHTIVLTPEVIGRSRPDLGDLRLLDHDGQEVPYILEEEPLFHERAWMRPFRLLRNERVGKRTVIEISADSIGVVDELQLRIRNAAVSKYARITGSDDRVNWYMVSDERLAVGEEGGTTQVLRFVDLPLSDHSYYRIELNDSLTPPVQVLQLGHSARARSEGRRTPITGLRFVRKELPGQSVLGVFAAHPFRPDRLELKIQHEGPFLRHGEIYRNALYTQRERGRSVQHWREVVQGSFTLTSADQVLLEGPRQVVDTLWLRIDNGNDRPLVITAIEGSQQEHRLIAKLTKGELYTLTIGDPKAASPRYDLAHFRDSIPPPVDTLVVPALQALPQPRKGSALFSPHVGWVWVAIIALGAVIGFSAVRLLRRTANNH